MLANPASTVSDRLSRLAGKVEERRSAAALRERLGRGCWVYGAGGYGQLATRLLIEAGYPVLGVVDRRTGDPGFHARAPWRPR